MEVAARLSLTRVDVERAHDTYVQSLAVAAWADGKVTMAEQRDLVLVAELLGVSSERVHRLIEQRQADHASPVRENDLHGKRVCFTGSFEEHTCNGAPLTRELAESLAAEAGLLVWPSVTKKVDVLVVADSNSLSTKARKARDYGTRIMTAQAFFAAIGVSLE